MRFSDDMICIYDAFSGGEMPLLSTPVGSKNLKKNVDRKVCWRLRYSNIWEEEWKL